MDSSVPMSTSPLDPSRAYAWIPTMDLVPGMVIARPVFSGPGMQAGIHLALGSALTASTIAQLVVKGVECIAVFRDTEKDAAICADDVRKYESRLRDIFGPNPDGNCRPLLDALLACGP